MQFALRAASPVRLVLLGLAMEAVFIGGFVLPYNLITWLPEPATDLGRMSGATPQSAVAYLASAVALIIAAWVAHRESRHLPPRQAVWIGFGFAALFAATLVWIYPFDALDLFDYAMHGRMLAVLHANPYTALPAWFPDDPFLPSVGWKTFPSVYGPLWTYLEALIGWASGDHQLQSLLLFKTVAALSSLGCTSAVYCIARKSLPAQASGTIILVGWNPLLVLMAGSGHNDLLVMALFMVGLLFITQARPAAGLWIAGASALVKAATVPILAVLLFAQLWRQRQAPLMLRNVLAPLVLLVASSAALYAPLWPGTDQLGPMLLANLFSESPLGLLHELMIPGLGEGSATLWAARIGQLLLVVVVGIAAWRARGGERATFPALDDVTFWLIFGALAWWQPWYIVWLICLAGIDHRPWAAGRCWVASLAGLVAIFDRFYLVQHWLPVDMLQHNLDTVLLVFLPPILWACVAPRIHGRSVGRVLRSRQLAWLTWLRGAGWQPTAPIPPGTSQQSTSWQ